MGRSDCGILAKIVTSYSRIPLFKMGIIDSPSRKCDELIQDIFNHILIIFFEHALYWASKM